MIRGLVAVVLAASLFGCGDDGGAASDATSSAAGTVVDPDTGIEWQNVDIDRLSYENAVAYCADLVIDGKSDFRLPSYDDLRSLVRNCPAFETGGECEVSDSCNTDDCYSRHMGRCAGCGPAAECHWPDWMEGPCNFYWSSTQLFLPDIDDAKLVLGFDGVGLGFERTDGTTGRRYVRCRR